MRTPNPLSAGTLCAGYPHTLLPALTKFYYLAQLGWWFHQLYVIHSEKPRKDHWQMFAHHILSITLIISSYCMNYTRIGTVVHVFMDFCDILLPVRPLLHMKDCY
jgi:acyl-CoA-dependent ceramide synthase